MGGGLRWLGGPRGMVPPRGAPLRPGAGGIFRASPPPAVASRLALRFAAASPRRVRRVDGAPGRVVPSSGLELLRSGSSLQVRSGATRPRHPRHGPGVAGWKRPVLGFRPFLGPGGAGCGGDRPASSAVRCLYLARRRGADPRPVDCPSLRDPVRRRAEPVPLGHAPIRSALGRAGVGSSGGRVRTARQAGARPRLRRCGGLRLRGRPPASGGPGSALRAVRRERGRRLLYPAATPDPFGGGPCRIPGPGGGTRSRRGARSAVRQDLQGHGGRTGFGPRARAPGDSGPGGVGSAAVALRGSATGPCHPDSPEPSGVPRDPCALSARPPGPGSCQRLCTGLLRPQAQGERIRPPACRRRSAA